MKSEINTDTRTEHSPLPWHIGMKPGPMVYGPKGEQVADCTMGFDESGHNANLIVQACNAHYELIEVLTDCVKQLDTAKYWAKQQLGPTATALVGIEESIRVARAAILNAKSV